MSSEDISKLQGFLLDLKMTTYEIVKDPLLIRREFHHLQERAVLEWNRASEKMMHEHNELSRFIDDPMFSQKLVDAGLSGDTLTFKLHVISAAKEFFRTLRETGSRARGLALVRLRRAGRRLLDLMDVVLGSLASILPGLEAVSEIKDTIAGMVADGD